jgi:hypothetical protein
VFSFMGCLRQGPGSGRHRRPPAGGGGCQDL